MTEHLLESAGKLPPFDSFGADVAQPGVLRQVARQIAFEREIILVCGDGSAYASPTALNTVVQFYALRLRHVLYVSDSRASCERLRAGLPGLACVWSSRISAAKPNHTGLCVKRYWDMRFYFYVSPLRLEPWSFHQHSLDQSSCPLRGRTCARTSWRGSSSRRA